MNAPSLQSSFQESACNELRESLKRIHHCVHQLSDEELWWRHDESMNSVANLLLHLAGNVRQWIVAGVGGAADTRQRQQEFDARDSLSRKDLMNRIDETVEEACRVISHVDCEGLIRGRTVQGFEVTGTRAIMHAVAHFQGHTQEIVHVTRQQRGDSYQFDFVPNEDQR